MNIFICKNCGKRLSGFIPEECECGFAVPVTDGVYQFTDDIPISVDSSDLKSLLRRPAGTVNTIANGR